MIIRYRIPSVVRVLLFNVVTILALAAGSKTYAQSYNSINYRWEQGFTATKAYALFQDSKGYIWIGTDNGLMRFNGRDFKVYTTRNGLPDNEILNIKEDSQGRLWLAPFTNTLCYMQHGRIYNAKNSLLLKRLDISTWQNDMFFDDLGNTWIWGRWNLTAFNEKGTIINVTTVAGKKIDHGTVAVGISSRKQIMLIAPCLGPEIYQFTGKEFVKKGMLPASLGKAINIYGDIIYDHWQGKLWRYTADNTGIRLSPLVTVPVFKNSLVLNIFPPSELVVSSGNYVYLINIYTGKVTDTFATGHVTGTALKARDGTLWFGTVGNGIYRFLKTPVKSVTLKAGRPAVLYIKGTEEGMYCTTDKTVFIKAGLTAGGKVCKEHSTIINKENINNYYVYVSRNHSGNWITCGKRLSVKRRLSGRVLQDFTKENKDPYTIKAVLEEDSRHILIGSIFGLHRFDQEHTTLVDTFEHLKRVTSLAKLKDVVYAGTLSGLFAFYPDRKHYPVLKDNVLLKGHITALCTGTGKDQALWIANGDAALIGLKQNRIFTVVDLKSGLQCNRISCLKASGRFIWVGTDNGLFAVTQSPPYNIVRHITYTTGLNNNQVNCLDIYKNRVWVGTVSGVNYFDEEDVFKAKKDSTEIIINSIQNGSRSLLPSRSALLLDDKPLAIDFDVVDFSGGSRPVFEYRLNDKGAWTGLEGNHLYFPALPSGKFSLTIRAFSPNWAGGAVFRQEFDHPGPYYHTAWFTVVLILVVSVIAGGIVLLALRYIRRRDREKLSIQQNLLRLEQMALQGQMNPHFIFNCIAAIKQHYNAGNKEQGNNFVDAFASLIRQTFEMGSETFVSLDKELDYLGGYLNVEKTRFNGTFDYKVVLDISLPEHDIPVPAMLLQPFVENAIRHGIRHLPGKDGLVTIHVMQLDMQVVFEITDNGIGIRKSMAMKKRAASGNITSSIVNNKRIRILNRLFDGKISLHVEEILPAGTRVIISYPVNINQQIIS